MFTISIVTAIALLGFSVSEPAPADTLVFQEVTATYKSPASPKELLVTLCGKDNPEPACTASSELSQDEAWLVLNHACRPVETQTTDPCKTFWQNHGGLLIFNLKTNEWKAEWEGHSYPLKFDVTGAPTLRLKPRQAKPLKVLVEEISPLAYSATPGIPKEDDVAVIAGLKSFLALAGTGIQGLVQTLAFAAAGPGPARATSTPDGGATDLIFKPQSKSGGKEALPPPPECAVDPPDVTAIAAQVTARHAELVLVSTALRKLEDRLDDLEKARITFVHAAQRAENGKEVKLSDLQPAIPDLQTAYDALDHSTNLFVESTDRLTSCQPLLAAYGALIGAPADGRVIRAFARNVAGVEGCEAQKSSALRDSLRKNAGLLDNPVLENTVCTQPKLKGIIETHRDAMKPLVERLLNANRSKKRSGRR